MFETSPKNKAFLSNCLIEAIKAKLRDWHNTEIYYVRFGIYPHFYWTDRQGKFCDFTCADQPGKPPITFLFFKGKLRHSDTDLFVVFKKKRVWTRHRSMKRIKI